jgi:hypothetical protein
MAYKNAADGIAKKGKTEGKNLGNSGPTASNPKGGKGGFHGARIRDIRGENLDTAPSPARKGCRFLPCFHGEFQNMHISPFRGETQGHGPTDAGTPSGHHGDLPHETIS